MPAHLTYSTGVGDTKLSNAHAKIYNDAKEDLVTDYSDLFTKDKVDNRWDEGITYNRIGKEIGVSTLNQIITKIGSHVFNVHDISSIADALGKKFNSDFSQDKVKQHFVLAKKAYDNIIPWINMQFDEDREVAYEKDRKGGFAYVKKEGKIVPVVRSFKNPEMAMYIDAFGRYIEYEPPEELVENRVTFDAPDIMDWDINLANLELGEKRVEEKEMKNFEEMYTERTNYLNTTHRLTYGIQPALKEIIKNNPTKYGDIDEAWSSKGGDADAAKNFAGGFEYGYYQSQYKNEYKNLGFLYQAANFKRDARNDNIIGMNDALPDAIDNAAGVDLGAEWAEKGLPLPSIEELAKISLEYADVANRPILTDNSLMNP